MRTAEDHEMIGKRSRLIKREDFNVLHALKGGNVVLARVQWMEGVEVMLCTVENDGPDKFMITPLAIVLSGDDMEFTGKITLGGII